MNCVPGNKQILWRLAVHMHAKPLYFLGLMGRTAVPFLTNLVMASLFLVLFDAAEAGDMSRLYQGLWIAGIAALLVRGLGPLFQYAMEYAVIGTTAWYRNALHSHLQRLPAADAADRHSGDLVSRLTNDVKTMETGYNEVLVGLLVCIAGGLGSLVIMFFLNAPLALLVTGLGIVFTVLNGAFVKPMRRTSREVQSGLGYLTERLGDILASGPVTRVFGLQRKLEADYAEDNERVTAKGRKRAKQAAGLAAANHFSGLMGFGGILILGGYLVHQGTATFGELVFMVQMQNMVAMLFSDLGKQLSQMQTALAGAERVWELLDTLPEPAAYALEPVAADEDAAIVLQDIDFSYGSEPVLQGLSFAVPQGSAYALVGSSGSGKTTVMRLLLGLYRPDGGSIKVGELDLAHTTLARLREEIAYVPQDAYLFAGTIRENILMGRPGAKQEDVERAAKAANADGFIRQCSQGYDTPVGERGGHLSGGQRQRIAIARAILKDAPVLLLDEATSALDAESERLVQDALNTLMAGKTTLVIAHRLSTIESAEQILVMDNGQLAEQGTHDTLLRRRDGVYRRLHDLQFAQREAS